jgi:hypothetical protein
VGVWVRVAPGATVDGVSVLIELDDGWVLTGVLTEGLSWDPHAASAQAVSAMTVRLRRSGMDDSLSQFEDMVM